MTVIDRLKALRCAAAALAAEKEIPANSLLHSDLRCMVADLSGHIEDLEAGS